MITTESHQGPVGNKPVFSTERLKVLQWRPSDEVALLDVYGNRDVVRWVDDGQPLSTEEAEQWVKVTRFNYSKYGYGMYVIEDRTEPRILGFGGLVHPGEQADAEVKYAFLPEFWGQGLATEFVRGLVEHAKQVHKLTRIIATVAKANLASQQVLRKCEFLHTETRLEENSSETEVFIWRS